jgi:hypothetical protein
VNLERLRWGDWIAAIAGLDLILVTFRGWYKVTGTDAYVTAWDALDSGRYLLIATGVVGILLLVLKAAEAEVSFPPGWLAAGVGFACTVYVAYRLATPPSDALDAASGIFFGLAGALGVTIGGLLSARDEAELATPRTASEVAQDTFTGPTGTPSEPLGELVPDSSGSGWSPAAPAPASSGWSPAAPPAAAAAVPPATAAGAAIGGERGLRSGDQVVLTAGGARYPAGTVAVVIEAFGGGALVEVKAPDGVGERFEVPDSAFEPAPAGGAVEDWSPAMPAPASDDWGFEAPGAADNGAAAGAAAPAEKKVPWWKREIGGGGKKKAEEAAAVGAVGAVAAGAAIASDKDEEQGDEKPGFFKRVFGGGSKAESDTAVQEPSADGASDDEASATDGAPGPEDVAGPAVIAADPPPGAVEPDPVAPATPEVAEAPDPVRAVDPEPDVVEPEPDPAPATAAESEVVVTEPEPEPAAEVPSPTPDPEPELPTPEPMPEPEAAVPEPVQEPEAAKPEVLVTTPEPEPEPSAPEPEPEAAAPEPEPPAAEAPASEEEPKPKRKRSSGSRKVPKEALAASAAGIDAPPKVGDEVQLKVGGGKFDAGTRGTVVDVFSAGVIVELADDQGRTERLDLPFEAIGPADK